MLEISHAAVSIDVCASAFVSMAVAGVSSVCA
jgi:hypothetical protein